MQRQKRNIQNKKVRRQMPPLGYHDALSIIAASLQGHLRYIRMGYISRF